MSPGKRLLVSPLPFGAGVWGTHGRGAGGEGGRAEASQCV
jgi:hypothetical protein